MGRNVPGPTCSVSEQSSTPCSTQAIEQGRGEVQSGRRRGHRARHLGVDRLIVLAVAARPSGPCGYRAATARGRPVPAGRRRLPCPRAGRSRFRRAPWCPVRAACPRRRRRSSSVMVSPGLSFPRVLQRMRQRPLGLASRKSPSQWPPVVWRWPTSRAGTTRVSLITRQSFGRRISGRSRMCLCSNDLRCRSTTSSRASVRQTAGDWAISSFGKS